MVLNTGREKEEKVEERVEEGTVTKIAEYKYLGIWINEKGNCMLHIEKVEKKLNGMVIKLKGIASNYNVGSSYIRMRMKMYEVCIVPSLLYNLEAWNKVNKGELRKLEQLQGKALRGLLDLPKTTPYMGILCELGMWTMEKRLEYRKVMLYQNIMNSNEERLSKRIIREQKESRIDNSFYSNTEGISTKYNIDINKVTEMKKSELKKKIKEEINKSMLEEIIENKRTMKKLRFVDTSTFSCKRYINELDGEDSKFILKTRLNMLEIYGNYKGNKNLNQICPHCKSNDDDTEHLACCKTIGLNNKREDLYDVENIDKWKILIRDMQQNLKYRKEQM